MKYASNYRYLVTALMAVVLLSGCSGFFIGDENLSEPVKLPSNPASITFNKAWQSRVGEGGDDKSLKLQPFVTSSKVFVASANGSLVALSQDQGERLWHKNVGHPIAAGVAGNDALLVVGSENGLLMAFSAVDGKPLWTYQLTTEIVVEPTVVAGLVVARTIDGQITALSEKDGRVIWKQNLGVAELSIRGNSRALFIDGALLYTNAKGRMTLLSIADGKPVLDVPISRGHGITTIERVADLLATPTIRGETLFLSAYRHETLAINLKDGHLNWRSDLATALDLFVDDNFVYIVDKNSIIHALDVHSGKTIWTSTVTEGRRISPISGNGDYIITVDNEGHVLAFNSRNGHLLGYQDINGDRSYIAPQWVNGKWLIYTSNGQLTLMEISQ